MASRGRLLGVLVVQKARLEAEVAPTLFHGHVIVRDLGVGVMLEMDGTNRDLVYQLFVCLRNKLTPPHQDTSKVDF